MCGGLAIELYRDNDVGGCAEERRCECTGEKLDSWEIVILVTAR